MHSVVYPVVCLEGNGQRPSRQGDGYRQSDTQYTLNSTEVHGVVYEPKSLKEENWAARDVKNAIRSGESKSSHAVVYDITGTQSNSMKLPNPYSCFRERETARTLDSFTGHPDCNQGGNVVVSVAHCNDVCGALNADDYKGANNQYVECGKLIVERCGEQS